MVIEIKFILTVKKKKRKRSVEIIPSTFRFKTSWEKKHAFYSDKKLRLRFEKFGFRNLSAKSTFSCKTT